MRILLTGGTGYLGGLLSERLTAGDHDLGCLVRDQRRLGKLEPLKNDITLISADDAARGIKRFAPDTVIHTAGVYARGGTTDDEVFSGNLLFPFQVLQAARAAGVRRWINTDTALPPLLNSYALSKTQQSQWGKLYAKAGEMQFVNLVLEQFYGPDLPTGNFLSWVLAKLLDDQPVELTAGTQRRDLIYIDDVLNVYEEVLDSEIGDAFVDIPVGTGQAPTVREVVEYMKSITGSHSELHFGAIPMRTGEPSSHCDTEMMRHLGVDQPLQWKDGLKRYVEASTHR